MRRLLVTGAHGFVGSTLWRMAEAEPDRVHWELIAAPSTFEIRDVAQTRELIAATAPDAVLHLAAISNVPESLRDPRATLEVNLLGTLNLLQALKLHRFGGPMVYVGSADVYGAVPPSELPIDEQRRPAPRNPYGVSKLAAEALCYERSVTEGIDIRLARPFNHIGPGQSEAFAIASFARQIAEIKERRREPVVDVGDIDVTRDFTDVRDVIRAYLLLLEEGLSGEIYNVCSGTERSVRSLIERLGELAGVELRIRQDPARVRPGEQRRVRGSPEKIRRATGWTATVPLDQTLSAMLDHWGENKT